MITTTARIEHTCPGCEKKSYGTWVSPREFKPGARLSWTWDCPHCDEQCIFIEGTDYLFNQWMNSQNPEWPIDGSNTGSLTL